MSKALVWTCYGFVALGYAYAGGHAGMTATQAIIGGLLWPAIFGVVLSAIVQALP